VPAVVAGYLLVARLATGILAAAPGAVDFVTTARPAGGRSASKAVCHAVLSMGSLALFALATFIAISLCGQLDDSLAAKCSAMGLPANFSRSKREKSKSDRSGR
jgi:uncharacterized membrane protein